MKRAILLSLLQMPLVLGVIVEPFPRNQYCFADESGSVTAVDFVTEAPNANLLGITVYDEWNVGEEIYNGTHALDSRYRFERHLFEDKRYQNLTMYFNCSEVEIPPGGKIVFIINGTPAHGFSFNFLMPNEIPIFENGLQNNSIVFLTTSGNRYLIDVTLRVNSTPVLTVLREARLYYEDQIFFSESASFNVHDGSFRFVYSWFGTFGPGEHALYFFFAYRNIRPDHVSIKYIPILPLQINPNQTYTIEMPANTTVMCPIKNGINYTWETENYSFQTLDYKTDLFLERSASVVCCVHQLGKTQCGHVDFEKFYHPNWLGESK